MKAILIFTLTLLAMAQLSEPKTEIQYVEKEVIVEKPVIREVIKVVDRPVIEYVDRPIMVEKEVVKEVKIPCPKIDCKEYPESYWEWQYRSEQTRSNLRAKALTKRIRKLEKRREKELERRENELKWRSR